MRRKLLSVRIILFSRPCVFWKKNSKIHKIMYFLAFSLLNIYSMFRMTADLGKYRQFCLWWMVFLLPQKLNSTVWDFLLPFYWWMNILYILLIKGYILWKNIHYIVKFKHLILIFLHLNYIYLIFATFTFEWILVYMFTFTVVYVLRR